VHLPGAVAVFVWGGLVVPTVFVMANAVSSTMFKNALILKVSVCRRVCVCVCVSLSLCWRGAMRARGWGRLSNKRCGGAPACSALPACSDLLGGGAVLWLVSYLCVPLCLLAINMSGVHCTL
jgi:hypothetical protein